MRGRITVVSLIVASAVALPALSGDAAAQAIYGGSMPAVSARMAAPRIEQPSCGLPAPSARAQIALLSAYEGQALSSVTIGSQDIEVRTASVTIAPGDQPLYVVITSFRPVIWRFTGATNRVERAVLISKQNMPDGINAEGSNLAGATGLPASRVFFPSRPGCLRYFKDAPSVSSTLASGRIRSETGRMPDIVAARYGVSSFTLPSGEIQSASADMFKIMSALVSRTFMPLRGQSHNDLDYEVERFYPGGVVSLDADSVVASATPSPYMVLPGKAGLQQLVKQGALEYHGGDFFIRRKIRFPAELTGAIAVNFVLGKGVPQPDGDPGHSCIVSEATGEVLSTPVYCFGK